MKDHTRSWLINEQARAAVNNSIAFVALAACWLLNHPYQGIAHDARLYTVQALSRRYPGLFAGDLFLMPGSQEQFTLFSRLWAPWIDAVGIGTLALMLVFAAHCLWTWGAVRLINRLVVHRTDRLLALAGAFALPPSFGGLGTFSYGEGFLSPRILAEAIVLHALSWSLEGRNWLAVAGILVSGLLHPLYALGGALIVGFRLCCYDRRWIWAAALGVASAAGLAIADAPPFNRLLMTFDAEWLKIAHLRCRFAFPVLWTLDDWNRIALQFILVAAASVWSRTAARWFLRVVLIAIFSALSISLLTSSVYANVLITQLQIWRILWVLAFLANAATGYLIGVFWRESRNRIPLISLLASTWCASYMPEVALPLLLAFVGLLFLEMRNPQRSWPGVFQFTACVATGLTVSSIVAMDVFIQKRLYRAYVGSKRDIVIWVEWLSLTGWFLLGFMAYILRQWKSKWNAPILAGFTLAAFLIAAVSWDRRTYWQCWLESASPAAVPFSHALAKNEQVFWIDGVAETWLLLRHPSYFSHEQGTGALFSRDNALEFRSRFERLLPLDTRNQLQSFPRHQRIGRPPELTGTALTAACSNAHGLAYIVSSRHVPETAAMVWHPPVPHTVLRWTESGWNADFEPDFYLYRCADLRKDK